MYVIERMRVLNRLTRSAVSYTCPVRYLGLKCRVARPWKPTAADANGRTDGSMRERARLRCSQGEEAERQQRQPPRWLPRAVLPAAARPRLPAHLLAAASAAELHTAVPDVALEPLHAHLRAALLVYMYEAVGVRSVRRWAGGRAHGLAGWWGG